MQLPENLQAAIEAVIESFGLRQLIVAREELTDRYRQPGSQRQFITTEAQRQAYVIARMPATYAAVSAVCQAIRERTPGLSIKSVLDLGAGPGTAMWAVCDHFPEVEQVTLIERDSSLLELGQGLAQASDKPSILGADWRLADLEEKITLPPHDLIILSYAAGELLQEKMMGLLEQCWKSAKNLLVVVEPGTPIGFERIRAIRSNLIEWKAHLVAPCPHHLACPMVGSDWCHFSARVERSSLHRRLKGGSLGYEDEKYSYIAVSKEEWELPPARILRHPMRHSGHIGLKLCTAEEGVQQPTISKKMGPLYKEARKAEWGDAFGETNLG